MARNMTVGSSLSVGLIIGRHILIRGGCWKEIGLIGIRDPPLKARNSDRSTSVSSLHAVVAPPLGLVTVAVVAPPQDELG
ncbi:hypothetical protein LWI28_008190 [Acer negundo]|uniref:Uncharacterized protein n=1 Tax=Acer negundo TaxID=4023 RepID=A0AAD5NIJ3_ACENE|nr:hypothetical protein LWI28_008190 [Acer negundo]